MKNVGWVFRFNSWRPVTIYWAENLKLFSGSKKRLNAHQAHCAYEWTIYWSIAYWRRNRDFAHKCPVHLPGQNIFCLGQNQICPRQNKFVQDKIYFVQDKNFVHGLKIIFVLGKLVSSNGQNFCPGQKIFCPGQNYFV